MGNGKTHVHGTILLCKHTPVIFVYFQGIIHINIVGETEIKVPQNRVVGGWWWVDDGQVVSDYKVITKPQLMYRLNQKLPLITFSGSLESGGSCSM